MPNQNNNKNNNKTRSNKTSSNKPSSNKTRSNEVSSNKPIANKPITNKPIINKPISKQKLLISMSCIAFVMTLMIALQGCSKFIYPTKISTSVSEVEPTTSDTENQSLSTENQSLSTENGYDNSEKPTLSMEYGYDNTAKYGRYMNISTKITNSSTDLSGTLQIIIPNENKENIMYQKELILDSNQTKVISMSVPMLSNASKIHIRIQNDEKLTLLEETAKVNINMNNNQIFVGILSDDASKLSYFNDATSKTFYLTQESLPDDYLGLDALDVIVINDYNTSKLSDKQYEAIKEWVNCGGTLVLGTGDNYSKNLEKFEDDFITVIKGNTSTKSTSLTLESFATNQKTTVTNQKITATSEKTTATNQINFAATPFAIDSNIMNPVTDEQTLDVEKIEQEKLKEDQKSLEGTIKKQVLELTIKDATTIQKEGDITLLHKLAKGKGNIQIATFDLSLNTTERDTIGNSLYLLIKANFSQAKQDQLKNDSYGNSTNWNIFRALSFNGQDKVPTVGKYSITLFIYVLLIGPVLYLILKKQDKRNLMWVLVPIFSVVFVGIIYGLGSDTRIKKPYARYLSLTTIEKDNKAKEEVFFNLTAPNNRNYNAVIDNKFNIQVLNDENASNYYAPNSNTLDNNSKAGSFTDYKRAIKYGKSSTVVELKNYSAFESSYYSVKSSNTVQGNIESDLNHFKDRMTGTVKNNLGYDLNHACILSDGILINLGELKADDVIEIEQKEKTYVINRDKLYQNNTVYNIANETAKNQTNETLKDQTNETLKDPANETLKDPANETLKDPANETTKNPTNNTTQAIPITTNKINQRELALQYILEDKLMHNDNTTYLIGFSEQENEESLVHNIEYDAYGTSLVIVPLNLDYTDGKLTYLPTIDIYSNIIEGNLQTDYRYMNSEYIVAEYEFPTEDKIKSILYSEKSNESYNEATNSGFSGTIQFYNYNTKEYDPIFTDKTMGEFSKLANYVDEENKMRIKYVADENYNNAPYNLPYLSAVKEAK